IAACPYKKIYFNWATGKSEKCILCYPRLETGQPPACFHSCVGRIRYMGVLLYDQDKVQAAMSVPDEGLVQAQLSVLCDPHDPAVIRAAERSGVPPAMIESAQKSPVYRYVVEWGIALPLHAEFRTLPMLYYVPPLLPVMGRTDNGLYNHEPEDLFAAVGQARLPLRYYAALFSAGNVEVVEAVMRKLLAVRVSMRSREVSDIPAERVARILQEAGITHDQAEAIYKLTSLCTGADRYVLPPLAREQAVAADSVSPEVCAECHKGSCGFGPNETPKRGA
ncbi:MAG: 4Fe-4S dicluster domain-containing protein, partial [Acidobacteriota bacterium]